MRLELLALGLDYNGCLLHPEILNLEAFKGLVASYGNFEQAVLAYYRQHPEMHPGNLTGCRPAQITSNCARRQQVFSTNNLAVRASFSPADIGFTIKAPHIAPGNGWQGLGVEMAADWPMAEHLCGVVEDYSNNSSLADNHDSWLHGAEEAILASLPDQNLPYAESWQAAANCLFAEYRHQAVLTDTSLDMYIC